jgi:tetratricopeptide (TPR) repeat protein
MMARDREFKSPESEDQIPSVEQPFWLKIPEAPQVGTANPEKTEQRLLEKLKIRGPRAETLKDLGIFYSRVGRQDKAYEYFKQWLKLARTSEELAECFLYCGQLSEQVQAFTEAVIFYRKGLAQDCEQAAVRYFLLNNAGFCYNMLGQHEEALPLLEEALELDPQRPNAYKNLGVALQAFGEYSRAASLWLHAIHLDASDRRAYDLLKALLQEHYAEVKMQIQDLDQLWQRCQEAVTRSQQGRLADWAKGLTLN